MIYTVHIFSYMYKNSLLCVCLDVCVSVYACVGIKGEKRNSGMTILMICCIMAGKGSQGQGKHAGKALSLPCDPEMSGLCD